MPSFRLAKTNFGDDLQAVAAREMGDANRWPELIWLNALVPPYITGVASEASSGVLLSGSIIKVPAPSGLYTDDAERGQVFERDCLMTARRLSTDAVGDLNICAGADNLRQQLSHAVSTPRGQARRHPDYGCLISRLKGKVNGPTAGAMAAAYVRATLAADYRVDRVESATAEVFGDTIRVNARAVAIEGGIIDISYPPVETPPVDGGGSVDPGSPATPGFGNNFGNNWGN